MIESSAPYSVVSLGKLRLQDAWRLELLHSQPHPRLYWITRGQGRVTIRGITRGYGPNTAIFLPPGTQLALELSPQLQGLELCLPVSAMLDLPTEPFHLRVTTPEAQIGLTGLLEKTEREIAQQAPAMARALLACGLLISAWITRELAKADGRVARKTSHTLVERYAQATEAQFRSGQGVAVYAKALGVTPTHLSRLCRDAAGKPAHALLTERVMQEACRLLRDTNMPGREIAAILGFSSAAYFTRAFQLSTERTPSEFRAAPRRA